MLELDQYGRQKARNVYGINLLTRAVDGEKYYYLYNGHADVTVLIDASTGLIAASYYYDAFGNILEETGAVSSPILYAGYQYDEETGLYYLNARMYDPKIARFLQEDTYRGDRNDPLSLHLYAYCFNNPLRYFDPTGHMGVAVRTAEEAKGNTVAWKAGAEKGKSTIIVTYSDGTTSTLAEGTDYVIGADGKAYYVAREEPGAGGNTGYLGQRKDSGAIAGALDDDIAPSSYATQQRYDRYMLASDETLTINGEAIADGTLLTTIGVTAVIVSVTVLTGGAGLPVAALVVAGGTAVAGTGATVMGTSEVVSGFTGTNWVLEELFDGNVEAYNTGRLIVTFGSTCGTVYLAPYYGVVQPGDAAVEEQHGSGSLQGRDSTIDSIKTPYGMADQADSPEALQLRAYIEEGGQIYRGGTLGRSNVIDGQFWAPENPLSPGYADRYGVDFTNLDFIIGGRQLPGTQFVTRHAPGLGTNTGGALEIVNNPHTVRLDFFHMP